MCSSAAGHGHDVVEVARPGPIASDAVGPIGLELVDEVVGSTSPPPFDPIIELMVAALPEVAPEVIVPAHCTGWRAQQRLVSELPDAYVPNAASMTLASAT